MESRISLLYFACSKAKSLVNLSLRSCRSCCCFARVICACSTCSFVVN